jgi:DNA repair protein RadD
MPSLFDHAGAVHQHGFVEDHVHWTLDPEKKAKNPAHSKRSESDVSRLVDCPQCHALRIGGQACRHCGWKPAPKPQHVAVRDEDLVAVNRNGACVGMYYTASEKHDWRCQLAYIARERGYKPGWISNKYKEKFKSWPPPRDVQPSPPTPEVRSWVRHRMIAYAKSQQKRIA